MRMSGRSDEWRCCYAMSALACILSIGPRYSDIRLLALRFECVYNKRRVIVITENGRGGGL